MTAAAGAHVIADITRRMGAGMAKYIERDVESVGDYDEYCHFVAGLVGVGLSQVPNMDHQRNLSTSAANCLHLPASHTCCVMQPHHALYLSCQSLCSDEHLAK